MSEENSGVNHKANRLSTFLKSGMKEKQKSRIVVTNVAKRLAQLPALQSFHPHIHWPVWWNIVKSWLRWISSAYVTGYQERGRGLPFRGKYYFRLFDVSNWKNGAAIYLDVWCRMEKTAKKWFLERSRTLKNSAFDPLNANHLLYVNINVRDWLDI